MIIYNDILGKLKDAGYTTTKLRKEKLLPESTIQRLRENKPVTTDSLDVICKLTRRSIEELIECVRVYASEDNKTAIMVDVEFNILKAYGLTNVLCCDGEGIIETEELIEVDYMDFNWSEES